MLGIISFTSILYTVSASLRILFSQGKLKTLEKIDPKNLMPNNCAEVKTKFTDFGAMTGDQAIFLLFMQATQKMAILSVAQVSPLAAIFDSHIDHAIFASLHSFFFLGKKKKMIYLFSVSSSVIYSLLAKKETILLDIVGRRRGAHTR
ncbi:hypothetical protein ACJX0J_028916, partial [Zea mays]